jgi:O-antigen ligase
MGAKLALLEPESIGKCFIFSTVLDMTTTISSLAIDPVARARGMNPVSGWAPGARLTLTRDPLRVLLFLLIVVTVSRVHLHYPVIAMFRPALLLSGLAISYMFINPRAYAHINVFSAWPMRVVALLFVLACCSVPFGISLGNSAFFILDSYAKTILISVLLVLSVRNVRDLYTYVWALVASCGILSYFAVFVFGLETAGSLTDRLGELYTYDSNDLGVLMMIGLSLTLLLLFVDRGIKRWLLILNLVGISAAMARSGSRGGFLGLIAVGITTLMLVRGISATRKWVLLTASALALAVASPRGYWEQMATIFEPSKDYNVTSIDGRTALIKRGIGYMLEYPIFGIGIWNFPKAECTISPKIAERPVGDALQCRAPHNSFIQAGAELGVPGLIAWASLVFGLAVAPLRLRRRFPKAWLKGTCAEQFLYASASFFPVAACGFAVTSFFVTFAFSDPIYIMAALYSALYAVSQAHLRSYNGGLAATLPPESTASRAAGWRVRASARRFLPSTSLGGAG